MPPKRKAASGNSRAKQAKVEAKTEETKLEAPQESKEELNGSDRASVLSQIEGLARETDRPVQLRLLVDIDFPQEALNDVISHCPETRCGESVHGASEKVIFVQGDPCRIGKGVFSILESKISACHVLVSQKILDHVFDGQESKVSAFNPDTINSISQTPLPYSSDRTLLIKGESTLQVSKAVVSLCQIISDHSQELENSPVISVEYVPRAICGVYGLPETFNRQSFNNSLAMLNAYTSLEFNSQISMEPMVVYDQKVPQEVLGAADDDFSSTVVPLKPGEMAKLTSEKGLKQAIVQAQMAAPSQQFIQYVVVPSASVGMIIGRQGANINEIRQASGADLKFDSPAGGPERIITVIGTPEANIRALDMIYRKVD